MKKGTLLNLDKERYLLFTLNSMRLLEKEHGIKLTELENNFSLELVQRLLHVGLIKDDPSLTFEETGDLVDFNNIGYVTERLTEALGGLKK